MLREIGERSRDSHQLIEVPVDCLVPHPSIPNVMSDDYRAKLRANIEAEGDYPSLIIRPHPTRPDCMEVLDGKERLAVLRDLGYPTARCYLWPCDDSTALLLVGTLDRLTGEDEPWRRARLLKELAALLPAEAILARIPESEADFRQVIDALNGDLEGAIADLTAHADRALAEGPQLFSFAVDPSEAAAVEDALALAVSQLEGKNRRGQALVLFAQTFITQDGAR